VEIRDKLTELTNLPPPGEQPSAVQVVAPSVEEQLAAAQSQIAAMQAEQPTLERLPVPGQSAAQLQAEQDTSSPVTVVAPPPSSDERIAQLEAQLRTLTQGASAPVKPPVVQPTTPEDRLKRLESFLVDIVDHIRATSLRQIAEDIGLIVKEDVL
jgi:hypothetical protein